MGIFDKFKKKKIKEKPEQKEKKEKKKEIKEKEKKSETVKKPKSEERPREVIKAKPKILSLAFRILKKPLISEKASVLSETGKYVFIIDKKAKKQEVKRAILGVYGIKPIKINFVNIKGKIRRYGKIVGQTSDYKKAIVTLPEGKAIQVHEGV
ncbi:MAG: 50S ribosomal protein L23 [Patescibacteria group bacterium]